MSTDTNEHSNILKKKGVVVALPWSAVGSRIMLQEVCKDGSSSRHQRVW
jgi:hypothetical protein